MDRYMQYRTVPIMALLAPYIYTHPLSIRPYVVTTLVVGVVSSQDYAGSEYGRSTRRSGSRTRMGMKTDGYMYHTIHCCDIII